MKKVLVWGKFDGLHEGHLQFLKHARELGDELYVLIIPDSAVLENENERPEHKAEYRKETLSKLDFITGVFIDSFDNGLLSILKLKPDIFAFGHDQRTKWEERLQHFLSSKRLYPQYVYLGVYNNGIHASDIKYQSESLTPI
jgi:cytidyltransferase-like protein